MIGTLIEKIFRKIYTLMKLNFMFIMITFMGGVILGIGPAFLSISDLYVEHKFNFEDIHFTDLFDLFRKNLKDGNLIF